MSGLVYLHTQKIAYYDLKSPNILVFKFPSVHEALEATQGQGYLTPLPTKQISEYWCGVCVYVHANVQS